MSTQPSLPIGSKDRRVGWYDPPITRVESSIRDLLENYSRMPGEEVIPRILETVSTFPSFSPQSPVLD